MPAPCAPRRLPSLAVAALAAAVLAAPTPDPVSGQETLPEIPEELVEVRETLDKYQDPYVAVREQYFSTVGCIEYPEGGEEGEVGYDPGAMGVHFLNPKLLDGKVDPKEPEVLVYNRKEDGSLRLVAAEWMVPKQAADGRPSLFGHEFQGPMVGHEPLMPEMFHHYDLHLWLWRDNPAGLFAPTNPDMECPESGYTVQEEAPDLVGASEGKAGGR